jgi:hypothetical protein
MFITFESGVQMNPGSVTAEVQVKFDSVEKSKHLKAISKEE